MQEILKTIRNTLEKISVRGYEDARRMTAVLEAIDEMISAAERMGEERKTSDRKDEQGA